jgi:hypothetical protein
MQDRQLLVGIERGVGRHHLEDVEAGKGPAMALGHQLQLALGLRHRHVEHALAALHAVEQELHGDGGLAGSGRPLDQVHAIAVEPATQYVVEPRAARRNALVHRRRRLAIGHGNPRDDGSRSTDGSGSGLVRLPQALKAKV